MNSTPEVLPDGGEDWAFRGYWPGRGPDPNEQYDFFSKIMEESASQPFKGRRVTGIFMDDIRKNLQAVDELLADLNPAFTQDHLLPLGYRPRIVSREIGESPPNVQMGLLALRALKIDAFADLSKKTVAPVIRGQNIPVGLLDEPPFYGQGDGGDNAIGLRSCFSTCTRMVFAGLVPDWQPHELALVHAANKVHGHHVLDDEEYLKIFESQAFMDLSNTATRVISMTGVDLDSVRKLAQGLKQRNPGAKCYTIVSLYSESGNDMGIWHNSVLLAANDGYVHVHDPRHGSNWPRRPIPKDVFSKRWTITLNRAHVIIAVPK